MDVWQSHIGIAYRCFLVQFIKVVVNYCGWISYVLIEKDGLKKRWNKKNVKCMTIWSKVWIVRKSIFIYLIMSSTRLFTCELDSFHGLNKYVVILLIIGAVRVKPTISAWLPPALTPCFEVWGPSHLKAFRRDGLTLPLSFTKSSFSF